jgi:RNA polymerase sigma-70 factor (ECF subfamily)
MPEDQDGLYLLLERIQQEDHQALGELYDATVNRLFGFVLKLTTNKQLAEEIVSDVYLQVWRTATSFEAERANPIGWLLMMARSRAIDALRREASRTKNQEPIPEHFDAPDLESPEPFMTTLGVERGSMLEESLQLLNEQQRQMIGLAFYRDMSHREIAEYTGEPLGTVKTTLRRSQAILRGAMTKSNLIKGDYYEQA